MAYSKPWRGNEAIVHVGSDEHKLKYAHRNLESTESVFISAARDAARCSATLQSQHQILQASLARMQAGGSQSEYAMSCAVAELKLKAQIKLLENALKSVTELYGHLTIKTVDLVGPFGKDKDYSLPQLDELTSDKAVTYKQQTNKIKHNPHYLKGWWDKDDPATWIPHGWKTTDDCKWARYALMATEAGHGLGPLPYYEVEKHEIGWDPRDPLTWVPFGWQIKDQDQWSQWHSDQKGEDNEESPHSGLLERDAEWVIENADKQDDTAKGKFQAEAEKSTSPPTMPLDSQARDVAMHNFKHAIEAGDLLAAFAVAAAFAPASAPSPEK